MKKTPPVQLFWVYSSAHDEDWFAVARTKEDARFHLYEGEPDRTVRARWICELPVKRLPHAPYVQLPLLVALGFKVIHERSPRVVWKDGVLYREGRSFETTNYLEDFETCGVYIIWLRGTFLYKIGETRNIHERLRTLRLNNPGEVELVTFIPVRNQRNLEWILKDHLIQFRYSREWYFLSTEAVHHVVQYANALAKTGRIPRSGTKRVPPLGLVEHLAQLERDFIKVDPRPPHPFDLKYKILPYIAHPSQYEDALPVVTAWARDYHRGMGKITWPRNARYANKGVEKVKSKRR